MRAMSEKIKKKTPEQKEQAPSEMEMLLPWHATGILNARDARCLDRALAGDLELARQYAAIRQECAEIIRLNEHLGAPPPRVMQKLFAAIDGEMSRHRPIGLPSKNSGQKKQKKSPPI
jgi:hypothetical protein